MFKLLNPSQMQKYKLDGFVYPIDVLSCEEVNRYLKLLEESETMRGKRLVKGSNFKRHLIFKCADELAYHPKILDAVEDIIGVSPSAALVRGTDSWGHFIDEPRPQIDYGKEELDFKKFANELFRAVYAVERKRYSTV